MSENIYEYDRDSAASDAGANGLETQRWALADCEQVFEGLSASRG